MRVHQFVTNLIFIENLLPRLLRTAVSATSLVFRFQCGQTWRIMHKDLRVAFEDLLCSEQLSTASFTGDQHPSADVRSHAATWRTLTPKLPF